MATPGNKMTGSGSEKPEEKRVETTAQKTAYKIHIPMYEGPLDLLLDLIKQQKMNIHEIQISQITAQYLDYLHKLEELDVDVSAEFIYMATNLIQFFEACPSRHAMIVAFLAVLEMVKLQAVALVQEKQFGDILVRKHKMFDLVFDESGGIKMIDEEYK